MAVHGVDADGAFAMLVETSPTQQYESQGRRGGIVSERGAHLEMTRPLERGDGEFSRLSTARRFVPSQRSDRSIGSSMCVGRRLK